VFPPKQDTDDGRKSGREAARLCLLLASIVPEFASG
jgi:hypothetical protein